MAEITAQHTRRRLRTGGNQWLWLVVLAAAVVYFGSFRGGSFSTEWATDFDAARQAAAETGRPLLVEFSSASCPYCVRMDREVLSHPDVQTALESLQTVRVDAWKDEALASRFAVQGVPAYVILTPDGEVAGRLDGFHPVERFITFLRCAGPRAAP